MPRRSRSANITCWWHKQILNAVGIKTIIYGTPADNATLFVANHLSWLDIHLIGSHLSVRFLSKAEVKDWPVFGWLASKAGTLYIPRGNKTASVEANKIMQQTLLDDQHVVLFPEAGTSDGNIKRFHSRLIQSAIDAQCLIQPVAIRYPDKNGNMHAAALLIDDISFMQSIKNIIRTKGVVAELFFLEPVESRNKSRDELAREAENKVRAVIEKN